MHGHPHSKHAATATLNKHQGHLFSELDLAQIARDLDQMEREMLGGAELGGDDEHGNLDDSGMFSSQVGVGCAWGLGAGCDLCRPCFTQQRRGYAHHPQTSLTPKVLQKALELWSLQIIPYKSQAIRDEPGFDPMKEAAFICNLEDHWFTLRRIEGAWWNLNSILPAPEPLSDFYVGWHWWGGGGMRWGGVGLPRGGILLARPPEPALTSPPSHTATTTASWLPTSIL